METKTKYHPLIELYLLESGPTPAFKYPVVRSGFVWACDGKALIRLDRDLVTEEIGEVADYPKIVERFNETANETELTGIIKADRLKAVLDSLPQQDIFAKCQDCLGDGEIECECCGHTNPCESCYGKGRTDEVVSTGFSEKESVTIGRQQFGARMLERLLKTFELTGESEAELFQSTAKDCERKADIIKFLRVQVLQMPVMYDDSPKAILNIS